MNVTVIRKYARGELHFGPKPETGPPLFGRFQIVGRYSLHFKRVVMVAHVNPYHGAPEGPQHQLYDVVIEEFVETSLELSGTEIIGGVEYHQHWVVEIKGTAEQDARKAGRLRNPGLDERPFNAGYLLTHFRAEDHLRPSADAKPRQRPVPRKPTKK
jgi:hypothetical protein